MRITRDAAVGIALLLICGTFLSATLGMEKPDFGQMPPALWPRIILIPLTLLSLTFLVRAVMRPDLRGPDRGGLKGWLLYYRTPLACFAMFFMFLVSMPVLGMLIGGILFVFFMLNFLGGWTLKKLALHGAVSIVAVGAMWSVFTFALGVLLPRGEIFTYY
jgi:putative tricarboxylic transport membrane protein